MSEPPFRCSRWSTSTSPIASMRGWLPVARRGQLRPSGAARPSGWSASPAAANRRVAYQLLGYRHPNSAGIDGGQVLFQGARPAAAWSRAGLDAAARRPHQPRAAEPDDGAQPRHARRRVRWPRCCAPMAAAPAPTGRQRARELFGLVGPAGSGAPAAIAIRISCPAGSSSASASPWRWPASPTWWCSTSRPRGST